MKIVNRHAVVNIELGQKTRHKCAKFFKFNESKQVRKTELPTLKRRPVAALLDTRREVAAGRRFSILSAAGNRETYKLTLNTIEGFARQRYYIAT